MKNYKTSSEYLRLRPYYLPKNTASEKRLLNSVDSVADQAKKLNDADLWRAVNDLYEAAVEFSVSRKWCLVQRAWHRFTHLWR